MDATDGRFAYLCVPLAIANQHGWELLAPFDIAAWWDGGKARESVRIVCHDAPPEKHSLAYWVKKKPRLRRGEVAPMTCNRVSQRDIAQHPFATSAPLTIDRLLTGPG